MSTDLRLRKNAAEFEGLLLSQVLEKLKDSYRLPGDETADTAGESFQSLAASALGNCLAAKGGLGIGQMLLRSLSGNQPDSSEIKRQTTSADSLVKVGRKD